MRRYVEALRWRVDRLRTSLRRTYRTWRPLVQGVRRPADETDRSAAVPFGYDLSSVSLPSGPIGVVCHIFHDDLAVDMRSALENIPFPADVFISTDTDAKRDVIRAAFAGWSKGLCEVRIATNRGRDIAPKLVTFRDVYERYELVLFLHSKKTLTAPIGNVWRETLVQSLVGSPDVVRSIVEVFSRHPDIGIVMCEHFAPVRPFLGWHGNFRLARRLAARMGIEITPKHVLDFPSGSMFWLRSRAIRPLLELGLQVGDFPGERGQTDGTVQHAIERLMLFVCERAGYGWVKIAAPEYFGDASRMATIKGPADLADFVAATRLDLLRSA